MCGIVGAYNFNAREKVDTILLQKMCNSILHRGPDDEGQYYFKNIGIGARRLSIIGVETGHQPISNEDKTIWVALNGEIYNYPELRKFLLEKGHKLRTTSDTECIVHLYEEFGEECVQHLRGMFAFAIIDQRNNSLFIARDRLGIKPLFYSITQDKILFGSEMKAILQDETVSKEIDFSALDAYFTYTYIPSPLTIFKSIRKLDPGHVLRCSASGIEIKKYWDLYFRPDTSKTEKEFSEEFTRLFDESVRIHLMSEVPLGAFLSGGMDSGLLVAFMARHMSSPVETFTIGFSGTDKDYLNERHYARMVAKEYHVKPHEFEVHPKLDEIIDYIIHSFDEPFADDSVIPSYYICKYAKEHVTVALTGLGGDELFGGYDRYRGILLSQWYQRIPHLVREGLINPLARNLLGRFDSRYMTYLIKRFLRSSDKDVSSRYRNYMSSLDDKTKPLFYSEEIQKKIDYSQTEQLGTAYFNSSNADESLNRAFYQDFKMYLPDDILTLSDRLSMYHSLELRVPFLDHKLVEFCATIPTSMKVGMFKKKHLLKKIAESFLPSEVIYHKKQGFAAPMASWLRDDLRDYAGDLLSEENLCKHGFFNNNYIKKILLEHIEGKESHHNLIFSLMIFQKWYQTHF